MKNLTFMLAGLLIAINCTAAKADYSCETAPTDLAECTWRVDNCNPGEWTGQDACSQSEHPCFAYCS